MFSSMVAQPPAGSGIKRVAICVLTYGDYLELAKRSIYSIINHCDRSSYSLFVGGNAVAASTRQFLEGLVEAGQVDCLTLSGVNLNQCPMMRKMFGCIQSEFIWWFDDDSFIIDDSALDFRVRMAEESDSSTVMWGQEATCYHKDAFTHLNDPVQFVRTSDWYRGLPPPSWKIGGKGEFDFEGRGTGNGKWDFIVGGEWFMRTRALKALDWPDRRFVKNGNDVFLGEAIRQAGWKIKNIGSYGVCINAEERRGDIGLGYCDECS